MVVNCWRIACAAAGLLLPLGSSLAGEQLDAPLPDPAAFLGEVRKHLASDPHLQSQYFYRERVTDIRMNPFGRVGTGDVRVYEVCPSPDPDLTYRRLIARNGDPIDPEEIEEQDRQYRLRWDARRRDVAREGASERERRERLVADARQTERAAIDDVLRAMQFEMERRELLDGRQTIVVGFSARPGYRAATREGRLVQRFRGEAWVDEARHQLVRVHAEAIADITIGLGVIARIHTGTLATFTRRELATGVWLPAETRFTGRGRAWLVRRMELNFVREYFDYQERSEGDPLPCLKSPRPPD